jgi:hypothetical protein
VSFLKLISSLLADRKSSLSKSAKIAAFGKILGRGHSEEEMVRDLLRPNPQQARERTQTFEEMLDFIESDEDLSDVMIRHNATRDELRSIYRRLEDAGWARGHYVPVSALMFGQTLHYALAMVRGLFPGYSNLERNIEMAYRLIKYFEDNESGMIPEAGPLPPRRARIN